MVAVVITARLYDVTESFPTLFLFTGCASAVQVLAGPAPEEPLAILVLVVELTAVKFQQIIRKLRPFLIRG